MSAPPEDVFRAQFEPIRGETLGPMVMGLFFDAVFFGVLVIQVFHWLHWSMDERKFTRVIVAFCVTITGITTFFNFAFAWNDLVAKWGIYSNLMSVKFVSWYRVFDCFAAAGTQIFFVDRAAKLSGLPKTMWIIFTPLIVGACAASITNFFILRHNVRTQDFTSLNGDPALITWIATTVGLDAALSLIIIYNLLRSKTGWANTDETIKRLVRVSLEAQVPSSLAAITFLLAFQFRGPSRVSVFFDLCIGKIYVVCLMSLLNAKIKLKRDIETSSQLDSFFGPGRIKQATVMVSTEVYTESHQMQRLPGTFGQPRRPPIAPGPPSIQVEEADIESDIEIKLDGTNDSRTGLTGNGYTTVRFNDMAKE